MSGKFHTLAMFLSHIFISLFRKPTPTKLDALSEILLRGVIPMRAVRSSADLYFHTIVTPYPQCELTNSSIVKLFFPFIQRKSNCVHMLLDLIRGKSGEQISLGWLYVHSMEHNCITYCKWGRGESNTQHITTPRIVFPTYCSLLYIFFRINILSLFQRIFMPNIQFCLARPESETNAFIFK